MLEPWQPVARAARVSGESQNFNLVTDNTVENVEGKSWDADAANAWRMLYGEPIRVFANPRNGSVKRGQVPGPQTNATLLIVGDLLQMLGASRLGEKVAHLSSD